MPKLSVCIPVEPDSSVPVYLVERLLENANNDIEVVVSLFESSQGDAEPLRARAQIDGRLVVLPPAPDNISAAQLWIGTLAAATGDWLSLVYPEDMLEPDLPKMLAYVERTHPGCDSVGWNSFQIAPNAPRDVKAAIAIPVLHHVSEIDKAKMLDAFFNWTDANQTPKMPFGLFHGAIKRGLFDTIMSATTSTSWLTPIPRYEWSARVVLFANGLALSHRPMSATSTAPYQPVQVGSALEGFPFDASIGLTAAIAEIQARVLAELGSQWSGFSDQFVRSCMIDCIFEHDPIAFERRCRAYHAAMLKMPDGERLAQGFRPQYFAQQPDDTRRGLHGQTLLVDRFIGNAQTAQEFYNVARAMVTPVFVITDGVVVPDA